ncbi:sugar ABC transporter permease [soil metagenome]
MTLAPLPASRAIRRRRAAIHGRSGFAWALLTPYLALLAFFAIIPVASALWAGLGGGSTRDPFGLATWQRAFGNLNFLPAVVNVATFLLVFLPVLLLLCTGVALLLHSRTGRFAVAMRLLYYIPGVVVGAPLVLLWLFMLTPQLSPFEPLLNAVGMNTAADVFTSQHLPAIFAVMAIYAAAGGWIVVLHGSLDALDPSVLEASRIDGANAWQAAMYVKLPLISRYVAFIGIISFAGAAQLVAEPNLVGAALPGTVSRTWSLNQLAFYYAFNQNDGAAASAYATFLVLIGVAAALFLIYGLRGYSATEDR